MDKGGESTANLLSRRYGNRKKGEKNEKKEVFLLLEIRIADFPQTKNYSAELVII